MEILLQDVRYALRGMRRAPGFTAAAVAHARARDGRDDGDLLRHPGGPPVARCRTPSPSAGSWSGAAGTAFDKTWVADGELMDYRRLVPSLESVAAWDSDEANLTAAAASRCASGVAVGHGQHLLDARARVRSLGRGLHRRRGPSGRPAGRRPRLRALAEPLRRRPRRSSDSVVELDGVARRVVGVMPRGFALPTDFTVDAAEPSQVWIPARIDPAEIVATATTATTRRRRSLAAPRPRGRPRSSKALAANLTRQGVYPAEMRFEAFAVPVDEEIRGRSAAGARSSSSPPSSSCC